MMDEKTGAYLPKRGLENQWTRFSTTDGTSIYNREWGTTLAGVIDQEVLQSLQQRHTTA
jgi:hypothetical protein